MFPTWLLLSAAMLQTAPTGQTALNAMLEAQISSQIARATTAAPAGSSAETQTVSESARLHKERGDNLAAAGKTEEAIKAYEEAIAVDGTYVDAYNQLGVARVRAGQLNEAIVAFDKALAIDATYATAVYNRGFAQKKLGNVDAVIQSFTQYVALAPDDAVGYFQLAEGHYVQGNFDQALGHYEKFLALQGSEKTKKTDQAKARVEELKKKLAGKSSGAAVASASQTSATSVLTVTEERKTQCRIKTAEGIALRSEGKLKDAVFTHQEAVNANPDDANAIFQLAESYAAMEFFAQAAVRFEKVVQSPTASATMVEQAKARLEVAYEQMALRGMNRDGSLKASTQSGGQPAASVAPSTNQAPEILTAEGQPIHPNAREASLKGAAFIADGKYQEAIEQYDVALAFHDNVGEFYSARGSAFLALRDATHAIADFDKASRVKPSLALPLYGMGEGYLALENTAEAKKYFEAFLKATGADATEETRQKAQERIQMIDRKASPKPQMH